MITTNDSIRTHDIRIEPTHRRPQNLQMTVERTWLCVCVCVWEGDSKAMISDRQQHRASLLLARETSILADNNHFPAGRKICSELLAENLTIKRVLRVRSRSALRAISNCMLEFY